MFPSSPDLPTSQSQIVQMCTNYLYIFHDIVIFVGGRMNSQFISQFTVTGINKSGAHLVDFYHV